MIHSSIHAHFLQFLDEARTPIIDLTGEQFCADEAQDQAASPADHDARQPAECAVLARDGPDEMRDPIADDVQDGAVHEIQGKHVLAQIAGEAAGEQAVPEGRGRRRDVVPTRLQQGHEQEDADGLWEFLLAAVEGRDQLVDPHEARRGFLPPADRVGHQVEGEDVDGAAQDSSSGGGGFGGA